MKLRVRGVDVDEHGELWVLGEDLVLTEFALDSTLDRVVGRVCEVKGIPASRLKVVIPPDRAISKLDVSLKQLGLDPQDPTIEVHPTHRGIWLWHPMNWYEETYCRELLRGIGDSRVAVSALKQFAKRPPVLRMSTRVLLRKYPDLFALETSLASQESVVRKNTDAALPLFY